MAEETNIKKLNNEQLLDELENETRHVHYDPTGEVKGSLFSMEELVLEIRTRMVYNDR